jgi:hypothetical protein
MGTVPGRFPQGEEETLDNTRAMQIPRETGGNDIAYREVVHAKTV